MRFPHRRAIAVAVLLLVYSATGRAQPAPKIPDARRGPDFGTFDRIQYHIGFSEFMTSSDIPLTVTGLPFGITTTAPGAGFFAHPHIPTGARLVSLELDYCDTSAFDHVTLRLWDCDFQGNGCVDLQDLVSLGDGCKYTVGDLTAANYTMLNNTRQLVLEARLNSGSFSNALSGAYIGYNLQVSPAPAVATFTDVPTTSPLFKFVEALSAAGITAGCGGGKFCPNNPITRGQMAVFLATALGLHFPD